MLSEREILCTSKVMLDKELTPTEKIVFYVIFTHAGIETKTCQVYLETIAKEVACCVRTVQRALKKLSKKNYIVIEPCFSINGGKTASRFTII